MVTNTPGGVLAAVVILPSCLDFTVVHRLLGQTSTCQDHGRNARFMTADCPWMTSYSEVAVVNRRLHSLSCANSSLGYGSCTTQKRFPSGSSKTTKSEPWR